MAQVDRAGVDRAQVDRAQVDWAQVDWAQARVDCMAWVDLARVDRIC